MADEPQIPADETPETAAPDARMLPDQDFIAKTAIPADRPLRDARNFDDWNDPVLSRDLVDLVAESTPLAEIRWAELYTYMVRRFGPPFIGGDDYKDLSGSWLLDSPHPDVFVRISPSLSGTLFSVTPYVVSDQKLDERNEKLPRARREEIAAAYRATLMDLLRPVCERDSWFNANGRVEDDDPLLGGDEDEDEDDLEYDPDKGPGFAVRFDRTAGHAMPRGLFGGADWSEFCALLHHLGDGDHAAGRSAAIGLMKAKALLGFRDRPLEARILAAAFLDGDLPDRLIGPAEMTPGIRTRMETIAAAKYSSKAAELLAHGLDFDAETVAAAAEIAGVLDRRTDLAATWKGMMRNRRLVTEWSRLVEAASGGEFPDACLPQGWPTEDEVMSLPGRLRNEGATGIASWSERVLSEEGGAIVLTLVLNGLAMNAKRAAKDAEAEAETAKQPGAPTP